MFFVCPKTLQPLNRIFLQPLLFSKMVDKSGQTASTDPLEQFTYIILILKDKSENGFDVVLGDILRLIMAILPLIASMLPIGLILAGNSFERLVLGLNSFPFNLRDFL